MLLLEHRLQQMGFDVEEVKRTQPQFFEMIMLTYQANMEKLRVQEAAAVAAEPEATRQIAIEDAIIKSIEDQRAMGGHGGSQHS